MYNSNSNTNPFNEIKSFIRQNSVLSNLLLINVSIWILFNVINVYLYLIKAAVPSDIEEIIHNFAVPASIPNLLSHPWSIVTYMFLHFDFLHILFNMLWLYWFGTIFLQYLSSRQLLQTYFWGGLSGGLLYIIAFNLFPVFVPSVSQSYAIGASASIMAIVTAISYYVPNYTIQLLFFGKIKIFYLAIILFVFDFFNISQGNSGGHIAHIGGAIWGFLYITMLQKGYFKSSRRPMDWMEKLRQMISKTKGKKNSRSGFDNRPVTDEHYNLNKIANQKRIDEILEKISRGGYESLTKTEKEFLFQSSGKGKGK